MKHTTTEVKLENGAIGLLIDVPGATVMDFEFNFRAGDYLVPRNKWEVPHLTEHVLLGANEKYPKARLFQAEFEKNGAYSNAYTSTYHITYESECADFEWERVLGLMIAAVSKPLFLPEEFKAEFGNVKDERAARSNNHFLHLHATTREAYGLLAMTDRECLKQMRNVKLKDLLDHYKRTHLTSNMRFIVAGNLSGRREPIKRMLEKIDLPKGRGHIELPSELPSATEKPIFVSRPSVKTLHFYIDTFALKRFSDSEWDALGLVNTMLTATLNSRILGEARERGLVYSMSSNLDTTRDSSSWWFGAQVIPKNAPALFEIIVRELARVRAGDISAEDLETAKQYLLGRYQRSGQTVGGIMAGYSGRYYFDEVIDDYNAVPDRIRAVTKQRIVKASERMFSDSVGGLGLLGDSKTRALTDKLYETIQPLWKS
jgi:predicted Zn-dependent peptidase